MKKQVSVFMLMARSTVFKITGLLVIMAGVEIGLFSLAFQKVLAGACLTLEDFIEESHISLVLGLCFLAMAAVLCLTGCEFGSRQGYTLKRLSISIKMVFLWQSLYNTICFLLLWAAQLGIALLLCKWYVARADPALVSGQTIFLAFYRSDFLHALLPLEETSCWIRNGILALGLGISSAYFPIRQRAGKWGLGIIVLAFAGLAFFPHRLGSFMNDFCMGALGIWVIGAAVLPMLAKEAEHEG